MSRVLELMRAHGSIEHAQRVADRFAASGLERLEAALADLPGRDAGERILETVRTLATRHA